MNIKEARQKLGNLWEQAKQIKDLADSEGRLMTSEEEQRWDKITGDFDDLKNKVESEEKRQAKMQNIDTYLASSQGLLAGKPNPTEQNRNTNPFASDEYQSAFWNQFRKGKNILEAFEVKALNIGTDSAGGYLVPNEFERTLIQALNEENIIRGLATVIQTSSGDRQIPVVSGHGQAFWTAEEAAFTESEETFAQKTLGAFKLTCLMKVSEELLNDSAFNLERYIQAEYARRIGVKEEEAFVNGDGVGKPKGFIQDAQVGVTTAVNNAITADQLIDLYHSLKRPYRARATFTLNDSTAKAVRKLKDSDGQYLWQPGLQAGQPDRLLGRPIAISSAMPEIASTAKTIAFGDLSYYWIADRQGRVFQRLGELYATNGQVGFRAYQRVDGVLTLAEAVKVLQMAV